MPVYVDVGISAIFLIAIIAGIIRGFAKQFTKGFCGFVSLIGSAGLTVLIIPALHQAGVLNGFASTAAGWFSGETFITEVNSVEQLNEVLSTGFLKILSSLSPRFWATMEANGMTTLGSYFGDLCARLIVGVVVWIVLLLLLKLIFWGIGKLLQKLSKLPVLRTLDRIFGALWSLAITYIIVVCLLVSAVEIVIIKWVPSMQPMLEDIINNSTVFQLFHDTNILGSYIARLLNVDLATLAPIV